MRDRLIFEYFGGEYDEQGNEKKAFADPIAIARSLKDSFKGKDPAKLFAAIDVEDSKNEDQAIKSLDLVLKATEKAFDIQPLQKDGTGLAVKEIIDLIQSYVEYATQKKILGDLKSGDEKPVNSLPMVSLPHQNLGKSITRTSTQSGSTKKESVV